MVFVRITSLRKIVSITRIFRRWRVLFRTTVQMVTVPFVAEG